MLLTTGCELLTYNQDETLSQKELDDMHTEATAMRKEGRAKRENADFGGALTCQTRALELSQLCNDSIDIVQDLNQLGTTFRRMSRLEQAISYHMQALTMSELMYDSMPDLVKNLVVSLNGLGNAHLSLKDYERAETCFRRALGGEMLIGSNLGKAINYANLGSIKMHNEEYDSAHYYYELSMQENVLAGSTMGQGLCHIYFGNIYEQKDQLKEAEAEYRAALELLLEDRDRWHSIESVLALGEILRKQGRLAESLQYADQALAEAHQMKSFAHLKSACLLKSKLEEQKGKMSDALSYYKEAQAWDDSVKVNAQDNVIRDICIKYEQDRHDFELTRLQDAYDKNENMGRMIVVVEMILLLVALVLLAVMWYASKARKARIEALDKLESMRTTFFRNITHEFRTPLTIILGLSNQLKDDAVPKAKRQHYLNSIEQQGNILLELVNQLLSLSKLMAGFGKCDWYHGDVVAYVRMAVASYSDFARMRNVEFRFVTEQDKIEMDFVPEYYSKILNNLIGNAFKYTASGGSITVKMSQREGHLMLDVIDTGTGLSSEDQQHLFELFYQGQSSRLQGNTGIGLPYVNQMVHHMGGIISVKDNLPHGTDMQIILSEHCNDETADIKPWSLRDTLNNNIQPTALTASMGMEEHNEVNNSNLPTLLVVEDNPDVAEYMAVLLEANYHVVKACDGYDALNKVSKILPDVILTDLMMPGMDGYQLCRSIRLSPVLADVPIVIVSAKSEEKRQECDFEEGADAYLLKPFNPTELTNLITRLLATRRQKREEVRVMIAQQQNDVMNRLHEVVKTQMLKGDLTPDTISQQMEMSRSVLARTVKENTGTSATAYILQIRMEHACKLLKRPDLTIGEISISCGFDDLNYFTRLFRQNYGMTPTEYRDISNNK